MTHHDDLQVLLDVEAIKALKARYFRLMDQKRWSEWGLVFTLGARLEVPEADMVVDGREAIVASVSGTLTAEVRTVHHGHMPEIERTGTDTARGTWAMEDYVEFPEGPDGTRVGLRGYGHYHEAYVRDSGEWRIDRIRLERLRLDRL